MQREEQNSMPKEASSDEDCLELGLDENMSFEGSSDHLSASDDDSDICVVYDNKVKQSRTAIEIVIDDDDVIDVQPETVTNADYIPLQSTRPTSIASRPKPGSSRPMSLCTGSNSALSQENDQHAIHAINGSRSDSRWQTTIGEEIPYTSEEVEKKREQVEQCRTWDYTNLGAGMVQEDQLKSRQNEVFTVMSYNVLAQSLLESHPDLYQDHDPRALLWEHRSQILFKELKMANPDVLCLQEVQTSHLDTFYSSIKELGYGVVHKQRTGDKGDGVAIYYKNSVFALKESTTVEFFQPGIPILNRDNVAIVAKLRLKNDTRNRCIVVATTHLLFNPRRHDVKLAQVQVLLAEVERFSYEGMDRRGEPMYCSSIITGDMNLEPYSGVYELLTIGTLKYEGLASHNLTCSEHGRPLDSLLIPHHLEITDTCQHFSILTQRPDVTTHEAQRQSIKLYSSETKVRKKHEQYHSFNEYVSEIKRRGLVNNFTPKPNYTESSSPPSKELQERCGTGQLSHCLNLRSVYNHGQVGTERAEVTTNQGNWITVDYIFYSCKYSEGLQKVIEGDLKLISRLKLPRAYQAKKIGPIPNAAVPSDHYPLAAVFLLK